MSKTVKLEDVINVLIQYELHTGKLAQDVQSLPQESKEQWISINDRLPETNGKYLCYSPTGFLFDMDENTAILIYDDHNGFGRSTHIRITHWQPLPAPPKQ